MGSELYIYCDGGLGNRLYSLVGGILISKIFNSKPIVSWPENNWCGCSFNDLYEETFEVNNMNINELFRKNLLNPFIIHSNQTEYDIKNQYHPDSPANYTHLKDSNTSITYYHNSIPPHFSLSEIVQALSELKIKKNITNEVSKYCLKNNIDLNTHGIHLRKTDSNSSHLSDETLINTISKNPSSNYFVCSDDKVAQDKFNSLKNVCVYEKKSYVEKLSKGGWRSHVLDSYGRKFPYNINRSKESVIEAFIDLLILSRTKILETSKSSFLKLSKLYSNIII